jgi:hypothetical protein
MSIPIPVQLIMAFWIANGVLSAAVQSLDEPTPTSGGFYRFIYKFLSIIVTDFKSFSKQIPL